MAKSQTLEYDQKIDRIQNRDAFGCWIREGSYYLTWMFYQAGLKGYHVLFLHFAFDLIALLFVYLGHPLVAAGFWFGGHVLDNCDGVLARARNEQDMKWGEIDVRLHLIANMIFWCIIGFQLEVTGIVMILLASRVVTEYFRQQKSNKNRYGERSRIWKIIVWPTNVNLIYAFYVVFFLAGLLDFYVWGYASYLFLAALGQSVR
jgi:phosphatidylglycerophosphate synthase